jgi:hypothetical protein
MLKKFYFLIFCIVFSSAQVRPAAKTDGLLDILQINEGALRENALVQYIKDKFVASSIKNLDATRIAIDECLYKNDAPNKTAFEYFVKSMYQRRLSHMDDSEAALIKAIQSSDKDNDSFLSYTFLNFLGYLQTEEGKVTAAVSTYRMAKKDAIKLNNTNLQMITDINISDVYCKNAFYDQSLLYLDQAQAIGSKYWPDDQRLKNVIYYNKSENFFRMNKPDSLQIYNQKLKVSKANTYKLYTYKNRTDYYLFLLHHNYKRAINLIHQMKSDEGYIFDDGDLQNLSDAYYKNGQPDSAEFIINQLLVKPSESNHPEIKYHLYDLLGQITQQRGDYMSATLDFKLALQQSKANMDRLTQVDNISALMKLDELEGYYSQKDELYARERMWLVFAIILALLVILIIAMFYRTIKQKRHYEKLLFTAKKEELAFINSHDVRKYLTNILGLIEVIRGSDNKRKQYLEAEDYLFKSAQDLDKAIKNISKKLDD